MCEKKLNILSSDNKSTQLQTSSLKNQWRNEAKAHFERLWLIAPEQFDPLKNILGRDRIDNTLSLLKKHTKIENDLVADLACGGGALSKKLTENKALVHALDISANALKVLKQNAPLVKKTYQECLPHTTLEDDHYDVVIANEVIAYLPTQQLRLFMAELCRLVKPDGLVMCSTALDYQTLDPLSRFKSLAETEFKIIEWKCSYNRLYLQLSKLLSSPRIYAKAFKDLNFKNLCIQERKGFRQKWFLYNTQGILGKFWAQFQHLTNPLVNLLEQSPRLLKVLNRICRLFFGDSGISHAIFVARRRPLDILDIPKSERPIDRKSKKEIWE